MNDEHDPHEIVVKPVLCHKEERPPWLAPQLPNPPFVGLLQAGVKSGKSCTISCLILSSECYKHNNRSYWDKIVLVSPNAYQDESIKPVADLPMTTVHGLYDDSIITQLEEEADGHRDEEGRPLLAHQKPKVLLILDDCCGSFGRGSAVAKLAMKYRQRNFSILISSQQLRLIPPSIRNNASWWFIFKQHNLQEVDKLQEEHAGFPGASGGGDQKALQFPLSRYSGNDGALPASETDALGQKC